MTRAIPNHAGWRLPGDGDERARRALHQLLAEPLEAARHRAMATVPAGVPLALYGAGAMGRRVLARLRGSGVEPVAFADDTPTKQGQVIDGLEVLRADALTERFGADTILVVTIFNPSASYLEIRRRLQAVTTVRVLPFPALAWAYPGTLLPFYHVERPEALLAQAADIRATFGLFHDDESRRQFVGHIAHRLRLDYTALPRSTDGDYFSSDVLAALPSDTTFVDCGAYDGDTIRRFLDRQGGKQFRRIFAFEPDPVNFRRLQAYVATLPEDVVRKVTIHRIAVGERPENGRFQRTGDTGAALDQLGEVQVPVRPLSTIVSHVDGTLYVKYDVEGAERAALAGAETLIRSARPILAVCVYHRPHDLWTLPQYLRTLTPDSRLFLRTLGPDGMDVVCYAIPERMAACERE